MSERYRIRLEGESYNSSDVFLSKNEAETLLNNQSARIAELESDERGLIVAWCIECQRKKQEVRDG